ncbi:MIP/aquaporin family protein [Boudabousia marimammalium]|uniref:Aquaporin family protein n=1 Tax=Boudabousia marimammalium TaxID=156892 RepID=A0A1Q5PL92_9ACTO|nr:MIP/aquaporin family protein [Boudabousia marimammalium]OKL47403.1 aquaporin family protein [Boudabousia marimammalium]
MAGLGTIFLSETVGTAMLLLLGGGVVANNILPKNKGKGTGFLMVNFGWGFAVLAGAIVANRSGGHINPAVTIGLAVQDWVGGGNKFDFVTIMTYFGGQMLGAFLGAVLCWLAYRKQFDLADDPALKLGVFSTGPEDRDYFWNTVTEAIGTFVLVFVIMGAGLIDTTNMGWLNYLGVSLLIVGIGASLGGPTGYAINPARDLGPRIAHAILPIKGKGSSDWAYSWVPVVGPFIGAVLAGLLAPVLL